MTTDPLEDLDLPTLAERIEPYRDYGDSELALSLWHFERRFGGAGLAAPADTGYDYHCSECETNVRGISAPDGRIMACPICGTEPGALTLGRGPK